MSNNFINSNIYLGNVVHKRFVPKKHMFNYSLYMLALDVDEIEKAQEHSNGHSRLGIFGFAWYNPVRFVEKDYLRGEPFSLTQRIKNKVNELNGHQDISSITMLVQARCFGVYFSPANFYFCYDSDGQCSQMLAEVSNTPWNERHYYLVDLLAEQHSTKKDFQVSPFMDLNMTYFWQVIPPKISHKKLMVKIENKRIDKVTGDTVNLFQAALLLNKVTFNKRNLLKVWLQLPAMTVKVVVGIYWQALKLFVKRIPFIGYQKSSSHR